MRILEENMQIKLILTKKHLKVVHRCSFQNNLFVLDFVVDVMKKNRQHNGQKKKYKQ
jgi:hypothetical protein